MWSSTVIILIAIAVIKAGTDVKNHDESEPKTNSTENKVKLSDPENNGMNSTNRKNYTDHDEVTNDEDNTIKNKLKYVSGPIPDSERNEETRLEVKNTYCEDLNNKFSSKRENLTVVILQKVYKIIVKSTERAPSRATAVIIATILKHVLGYNNVFIQIDNRTNCELATTLDARFDNNDEIIIHVDAAWKGPEEKCPFLPRCPYNWTRTCGIAGPRLSVIGATPGVNIRLHAALQSNVSSTFCQNTYNQHNLEKCGFFDKSENNSKGCIPLLIPPDVMVPVELNLTDIDGIALCQARVTNRSALLHLLKPFQNQNNIETYQRQGMDNRSFFFIDYDFYEDNEVVRNVHIPIKYTSDITALRVADYHALREFAPLIVDVLNMTKPRSTDLRAIVDLNATLQDLEEATCAWANKNINKFQNWTATDTIIKPWIAIILCKDDSDYPEYLNLLTFLQVALEYKLKNILPLKMFYDDIICSNKLDLNSFITNRKSRNWQWLAAIVASGEGVEAGIDASQNSNIQMVLYDVPLKRLRLNNGAVSSTGSLPLLAQAICYFFKQRGWRRIAIISEQTFLAEDISEELQIEKTIVYREYYIEKGNNVTYVDKVLADLKKDDARIIFINTGPDTANLIACRAAKLGMDFESEYAWIAREWRPIKCNNMRITTISYGWRGQYSTPINDTGRDKFIYSMIEKGFEGRVWPPLAASLADAILLIVHRVTATVLKQPYLLYNLHGNDVSGIMAEITKINTGIGLMQSLELHDYMRANPLIYVNVWRGEKITSQAIWRGLTNSQEIVEVSSTSEMDIKNIPKDGSESSCLIPSGDPFTPSCDDAKWICGTSVLLLAFSVLLCAKRRHTKLIKKRERDTLMRLLTRCEKTAFVLSSYLVKRSDLELLDELGYGHFGRVRFGLLRRPNRKPTPIAAKALRKDAAPAEEAEFLREASTLAGLSHTHIIGFVGVCADTDGPPLLLMEHAFFGDLLRYLRARRYLAETKDEELDEVSADYQRRYSKCSEKEECYVSAVELTRLACEAALALAYLNECHLLHRDVRAANCLIDTKRSLKLADFGMARCVSGSAQPDILGEELEPSSDYKYICRRRGVFPVPWMAPESLEMGEFSHASDIWALGVLILEVATLGARPFGVWRPLTVLRYVRNGGRPPLPIDASYYTTEVTEMCWADLPKRATAAEVYDYLRAHPTAIRAALRPAWPEPDVSPHGHGSDSGFGDTHADHHWTKDLRVSTM